MFPEWVSKKFPFLKKSIGYLSQFVTSLVIFNKNLVLGTDIFKKIKVNKWKWIEEAELSGGRGRRKLKRCAGYFLCQVRVSTNIFL